MESKVLWTIRRKIVLTVLTVVIVVGVLSKFFTKFPISHRDHLYVLLLGYILASVRSWWKDRNDAKYRECYRSKELPDLLPTYILNYPVYLLSAYFLTIHTELLVIPFLVGWSVDYLWQEGNIFSGLSKIFKKEG